MVAVLDRKSYWIGQPGVFQNAWLQRSQELLDRTARGVSKCMVTVLDRKSYWIGQPGVFQNAQLLSSQELLDRTAMTMTHRLLTEHHLEFLSLKGGCTGASESTLVKMSHCRKSHVMALLRDYHL